jgi:uncharacterized protein YndB with AHSA1/START domain
MNDYQKTITVNKPVSEVYTAITEHISEWWSNDLTGSATNAGDSFIIAFGETRKTMVIEEAIPNKRVVWKCIKAHIAMPLLKNKAEWVDTKMIWTFVNADQATTLHFLHEGLNQSFECYDICEAGWDEFLSSLKTYLATGKGMPFLKKPQTVS